MESQQQQMESSNCISPGVIVTEPSTSSTSMNETTTADQGKNAITTSSVTDTNGNHISNKGNSSNMTNGNKTNVVIVPPSPTSSVASASSVVTTSMVTSCVSPSSLPSSTVVSSSSVGHSSQEVTSMVTSVVTSVQSVVDQEPQHPLQTSVVVPPLSYHTSSPSNSGHTVYSSQVNHSHGTHGNPNSSNNNIGSNNSGNGVGPPLPVESVQQPQQSYQTQQTGSSSSSSYHYSYTSQVMPEQVAYVIMESSNTSHEQQSQQLHSHSQVHSLDQDSNSMVNLQTGGNLVSNNNNSQRASPQEDIKPLLTIASRQPTTTTLFINPFPVSAHNSSQNSSLVHNNCHSSHASSSAISITIPANALLQQQQPLLTAHHYNALNPSSNSSQNHTHVASSSLSSNTSSNTNHVSNPLPPSGLRPQNIRDIDIAHVQWLMENYETAEGVSLPRSTLYTHYINHCSSQGIDPVNAASFGKLIRSVFVGLRTRRLGTRGNSKYHYYGIRVKPGSILSRMVVDTSGGGGDSASSCPTTPEPPVNGPPPKKSKGSKHTAVSSIGHNSQSSHHHHQSVVNTDIHSNELLQSHLGDPQSILPSVWPDEPIIPSDVEDPDAPSILATKFAACYRKHYEEIITALGSLNFNSVEVIWKKFWQPGSIVKVSSKVIADSENNNNINSSSSIKRKSDHEKFIVDVNGDEDPDLKITNGVSGKTVSLSLTLNQLRQLTNTTTTTDVTTEESTVSSLADWIIQTDYTLYNSLITALLLPNLLKPIPQQLTQQIRNFAKNIESWMESCLEGYDPTFVALKLGAVGAFSHTLRRYTSLNHLSSAARAVLQNQQQIHQMISDLNRVDFKNVQEQASWVCQCEDDLVTSIEHSFKQLLQDDNPFDRWGNWCLSVLDSCLNDSTDARSATQFFFKWGFYSSLVMRDLTLRSASSFGSFHLIRLLFDEYIFYLIEHRVAKATNKTPLQVIGEARSLRGATISSATLNNNISPERTSTATATPVTSTITTA